MTIQPNPEFTVEQAEREHEADVDLVDACEQLVHGFYNDADLDDAVEKVREQMHRREMSRSWFVCKLCRGTGGYGIGAGRNAGCPDCKGYGHVNGLDD